MRVKCQHEETRYHPWAVSLQWENRPRVPMSCQAHPTPADPSVLLIAPAAISDLCKNHLTLDGSHQSFWLIAEACANTHTHTLSKYIQGRLGNVCGRYWSTAHKGFPFLLASYKRNTHFQETEGGLLICFGCVSRQPPPWPDQHFLGFLWPVDQKQTAVVAVAGSNCIYCELDPATATTAVGVRIVYICIIN